MYPFPRLFGRNRSAMVLKCPSVSVKNLVAAPAWSASDGGSQPVKQALWVGPSNPHFNAGAQEPESPASWDAKLGSMVASPCAFRKGPGRWAPQDVAAWRHSAVTTRSLMAGARDPAAGLQTDL